MRMSLSGRLVDELGSSRDAMDAFNDAVAGELKKVVEEDFEKRAVGGVGADGRKWKALSPNYLAYKIANNFYTTIGRKTGGMRKHFLVWADDDGVVATFEETEHCYKFDNIRPLLPDHLPDSWEKRLSKAGETALDKFFK